MGVGVEKDWRSVGPVLPDLPGPEREEAEEDDYEADPPSQQPVVPAAKLNMEDKLDILIYMLEASSSDCVVQENIDIHDINNLQMTGPFHSEKYQ